MYIEVRVQWKSQINKHVYIVMEIVNIVIYI